MEIMNFPGAKRERPEIEPIPFERGWGRAEGYACLSGHTPLIHPDHPKVWACPACGFTTDCPVLHFHHVPS